MSILDDPWRSLAIWICAGGLGYFIGMYRVLRSQKEDDKNDGVKDVR